MRTKHKLKGNTWYTPALAHLLQGDNEHAVGATGALVHPRRGRDTVLGAGRHHRDQLLTDRFEQKRGCHENVPFAYCSGRHLFA